MTACIRDDYMPAVPAFRPLAAKCNVKAQHLIG